MKEFSRVIELRCRNAGRYSQILYSVLASCGYSAAIDSFDGDTAFVLLNGQSLSRERNVVSADMIVFDDSFYDVSEISRFRVAVTDYENPHAAELNGIKVFTFSEEHYGADLASRNVSVRQDELAFDIVSGGILSRVRITKPECSVRDILLCAAVLISAGIPIASIVSCLGK